MNDRWLGAVEGYYGPPLEHDARLSLVEWLATEGFNCYAYAPKLDPYHRAMWREPYPADQEARFRELLATGTAAGVPVALALSPGLDWVDGDEAALVRKMTWCRELGATVLAIAWDDVAPGGAELGETHGRAVAAAVEAVGPGVRWVTCPTDYATPIATPYLGAFVDALPDSVDVMWTGPSIVSTYVTGAQAKQLAAELGRPLLFAENFPVNDGGMSGALHLGPYPDRSPDLPRETTGVFCNFMSRPLASRIGLAVAARFWRDPAADREATWTNAIAEVPGLAPLARASHAWADAPGPDPELLAWAAAAIAGGDERLRQFLWQGCRSNLDPALAAELEPWLEQWERESHAMQFALQLLDQRPRRSTESAFAVLALWERARSGREQLFGIRWAHYPLTTWDGETIALPACVVQGANLTDIVCESALGMR